MTNIETELLDELCGALRGLPRLELRATSKSVRVHGKHLDLLARVGHEGQEVTLFVECKKRGYPREIKQALEELRELEGYPVVAAPSLSIEARELLRRNGVGYFDSGGSLSLELPWALYLIDRPAPKARTGSREPRNLYRGRTAQSLHALLLEPKRAWKVHDLAGCADVSDYTAHQVLQALENQLWVESEGRGPQTVRYLRQPGRLLDAWTTSYSFKNYARHCYHRMAPTVEDLESALAGFLDHVAPEWVFTLEYGAHRRAPYLHHLPGTITAIVPDSIAWDTAALAAGFRPVDDGENIVLLSSPDRTPFLGRELLEKVWIASPVQLYLDLSSWPRRGREQAQHLRGNVLDF